MIKDYLQSKGSVWITAIITLVVVVIYYYFILSYDANFPFHDDFNAVLRFLAEYKEANGQDKWNLLFSQHNEHRIFFVRLISLLYYLIAGEINFTALCFIGNLSFMVIGIYLFRSSEVFRKNAWFFLPVIFLMVNYKFAEVLFWAMASLQNLWVIAFAFVSLYLLFREEKYSMAGAVFFAALATYTSGNGIMTFVAGIILLGFNRQFNLKFLIWTGAFLLFTFFYFYSYQKPHNHPSIVEPLMNNPWSFFAYCFAFMGSAASDGVKATMVAGIINAILVLILTLRKYYKTNPTIYAFVLFLLLTTFVNGLGRFGFGTGQALSARYAHHSAILMSCLYIGVLEILRNYKIAQYATVFALVLFSFQLHRKSYGYIPEIADGKKLFLKKKELLAKGEYASFEFGWPTPDKEYPRKVLKISDSLGVFKFPYAEPYSGSLILKPALQPEREMLYAMEPVGTEDSSMVVQGWALIKGLGEDTLLMPVVQLHSESNVLVKQIFCNHQRRPDVAQTYSTHTLSTIYSGFRGRFSPGDLAPGNYSISIVLVKNDQEIARKKTDKTFHKP